MFSIHDAKVQHIKSPNSRNVMNRHELASYCELFIRVFRAQNILWMISNVAHPTAPRLRFSFL